MDLNVYNRMGGFSNGYVPMFIVVGRDNKVYYNDNPRDFRAALRQAIQEMQGMYVQNPLGRVPMLFNGTAEINVSDVFFHTEGEEITVTVESNSDGDIVSVNLVGDILYLNALEVQGISTIVLRGTGGEYTTTDEITVSVYDPVNYAVEDFETGDFSKLAWEFAGHAGWVIDTDEVYEGSYSARSGDITHNQNSVMQLEVVYDIPGTLSFYSKASSEANWDLFRFLINGEERARRSGNTDWRHHDFDIEEGTHVFTWRYQKDGSGSFFEDCAWVDNIVLFGGRTTGIYTGDNIPEGFVLNQNYPNPFNPETAISFDIPSDKNITLSIFNSRGELVSTLHEGILRKGSHEFVFSGAELTSGVYFYKLESEGLTASRKMILLK